MSKISPCAVVLLSGMFTLLRETPHHKLLEQLIRDVLEVAFGSAGVRVAVVR